MKDFKYILLPKGESYIVAQVNENDVIEVYDTNFSKNIVYDISSNGYLILADCDSKKIKVFRINESGQLLDFDKESDFEDLWPTSIKVIDKYACLGGKRKEGWSLGLIEYAYKERLPKNLRSRIIFRRRVPFEDVQNGQVFVLDGQDGYITLIDSHTNGSEGTVLVHKYKIKFLRYESTYALEWDIPAVKKVSLNDKYLALLSNQNISTGEGKIVTVFNKDHYDEKIFLWSFKKFHRSALKELFWNDIYLVPNSNILLISALNYGIGVYQIKENEFSKEWNKLQKQERDIKYALLDESLSVQTISMVPNDPSHVIIVCKQKKLNDQIENYVYQIRSVEYLVSQSNITDQKSRKMQKLELKPPKSKGSIDWLKEFESEGICPYCHESPCMCSDPF